MLPQATFSDSGNATAGTVYGGPYTGPDTVMETNLSFLDVTENVKIRDAIAQLVSGAAPAQQHAYLVSVGDVTNVVGVIYSTQIPPNSNLRTPPPLKFAKGERVFVRGCQLSGSSAEATQLVLSWGH
jgi:hypothetical protein